MPFQSTAPGDPLPPNSPVKIFFHGLLILRASSEKDFCLVETLRNVTNPTHTLSVEVRTKAPNKPDVIHMRHFGPLGALDPQDPQGPGLKIEVLGTTPPAQVFKHQPSGCDPVLGTGQATDFRWILDLQKLHSSQTLSVDPARTRPFISIMNGIYHFHTADRKTGGVELMQGGQRKTTWVAMASIVGADISIPNDGKLVMNWNDGQSGHELKLDRPTGGVSHEIYIDNSPLYLNPAQGVRHGELEKYYEVITPQIPESERFSLNFLTDTNPVEGQADKTDTDTMKGRTGGFDLTEGSAKYDSRMTPRIPCQPIVLEG
jgi:hypothetical protein